MSADIYDVAVVGGGIVGLATARALLQRVPDLRLCVVEKEPALARHQTGRNSGVIHSGIYYRPGSLKAKLCVTGARRLIEFCHARGIPVQPCGKVIVAAEPSERPALARLYERGQANGVAGLRRIGPERLRELEPNVRGLEALHLPGVAIVDYVAVAGAMAWDIQQAGGAVMLSTELRGIANDSDGWRLDTTQGRYRARMLINCGGLHADRIARLAREDAPVRVVPFRGEYYQLPASRAGLVNGLVYPVPDASMPFLGIHFTKTLTGGVHVGPNAVLALKREGYRRRDISMGDSLELLASRPFWRMARRYWRAALTETARSWSRRRFLRAAQRLVPSLEARDLLPCPSGVRAQAIGADGALVDDFVVRESEHALHVYNAPSPAATASLEIGEFLAERVSALLSRSRPVSVGPA